MPAGAVRTGQRAEHGVIQRGGVKLRAALQARMIEALLTGF